jgi:intein/homing endonuclease
MIRIHGVEKLMNETKNVKIIESDKKHSKIQIIKGSNKVVNIPHRMSEDLSYIIAAIICDGHLKTEKYRISFEVIDIGLIKKFLEKMHKVFKVKGHCRKKIDKRGGRKAIYMVRINSKPIVVFLNNLFEIPRGRKSGIVKVPEKIMKSNLRIKKAFIEGVFDTDGGKRRRGFGLSSASKEFRDGMVELLSELKIFAYKDEWVNKKYNKKYYGLYFKEPL